MKIRNVTYLGRKAWELDNEAMALTMTVGGGHIASLRLDGGPRVNPLWVPVWKSLEPWQYKPAHKAKYTSKLLASILGHNVCLGCFGGPSDEEGKAGMQCHGEAPVAKWELLSRKVARTGVSLKTRCVLPVTGMTLTRTISARRGRNIVRVRETLHNVTARDIPYTMAEHVTFSPPFLEKGVTLFDMPATRGHTYPVFFEKYGRLRQNAPFTWPDGPGARGRKVDLRTIGREYLVSSDFSTQLMNPRRDDAWFSALNPRLGLLVAYVWNRADFPWIGNWEENRGRKRSPWAGKSLTRGMEFANTPFPMALRKQVDLGRFHGLPTFRWLPARSTTTVEYSILMAMVPFNVTGVEDIVRTPRGMDIHFKR